MGWVKASSGVLVLESTIWVETIIVSVSPSNCLESMETDLS